MLGDFSGEELKKSFCEEDIFSLDVRSSLIMKKMINLKAAASCFKFTNTGVLLARQGRVERLQDQINP